MDCKICDCVVPDDGEVMVDGNCICIDCATEVERIVGGTCPLQRREIDCWALVKFVDGVPNELVSTYLPSKSGREEAAIDCTEHQLREIGNYAVVPQYAI